MGANARKLLVCIVVMLALTTVNMVIGASSADAAGARMGKAERKALREINRYRVHHGLPRLRANAKLTSAARWMARDMIRYQYFAHTDHRGRSPFDRLNAFGYRGAGLYRGENLAAGRKSPHLTIVDWKNSPAHNANLLEDDFRAAGIVRIKAPEGAPYRWYWAMEFGSSRRL
jgi:uncharacterized protein YkwD